MGETLRKDIRQSFRILIQNPAFALAALAALTLGIGTNTAIFSVVDAVMLRPVDLPDPDRIVVFQATSPQGTNNQGSPAKFQHWRSLGAVVGQTSAFRTGIINYTGGALPEQLRMGQVSADFFALTGARAKLGRTFSAEEDQPNGPHAVVLTETIWRERFNADPAIVGKPISLSGDSYTVVGVLDRFTFAEFGPEPALYLPFQLDPNTADQGHYFQVAGRVRAGVTLKQAQARVAASAAAYNVKFPNALGDGGGFSVQPIRDVLVQNVRPQLLVLVGAVSFVLLIACANVANLLLARATGRTREIAIRAAIGGSRGRIIRQLLTESVMLSLIGGALGLALGLAGIRALFSVNTANLPRVGNAGALVVVDWRVAAFAIAVSLATGLVFGLIPAIQSSRVDLTTSLKESSGRSGTGVGQNYARAVLVIVEVGLALVLLVGSTLLIRTAVKIANVDPGFDARNVITMRMSLTGDQFKQSAMVDQLIHNTVERLKAMPSVENASATCCVPLQGGYGLPFRVVGRPLDGPFHGGGGWVTVSPGYFEVFRIPVTRGRTFTERDTAAAQPVVVINEAMARQFFPDTDALQARLVIGRGVMREFESEPERQIIGIVADSRDNGLNADPQPKMFIPQAQVPDPANALNVRLSPMAWVIRTRTAPDPLSQSLQDAIRQSTGIPVSQVQTMTAIVSRSTSRQRFNMWLMTVFGSAALLLAAIGIYGLMAYSVAQRTQEIGIRIALGAQAASVRNMIVLQGMRLTIIGVAVGLAAAFPLARYLSAFLFQVQKWDVYSFVAVPSALIVVALASVWIPAMRASRVDPIHALRGE